MQKLRAEFWYIIGKVNLENLVFVDEAGVNLAMSRLYARAFKGKRAHGSRPDKRAKNVRIIEAMALSGMTFQGKTDTQAFLTFIKEVLVPQLWSGATVVVDNFSSHLVAGVREAIEEKGAQLVYLLIPLISLRLKIVCLKSRSFYVHKQPAAMNNLKPVTLQDITG